MNDVQVGRRYRALRQRLGWRQIDLAERSGVSRGVVSLVERGRLEEVTLRNLRAIARQLEAELTTGLWWRGGDLDRLIDEGHAHLTGAVVEMLRSLGWVVKVEVTYAIYRDRGSIDVLAWHPRTRMLLVVEAKTELTSVEDTLRKHDEKVRLAPRIAPEQFGWRPVSTGRLLVLPSLATPRRRVERHSAVMAATYPTRGHDLRRWLAEPAASVDGLLFINPAGAVAKREPRISKKRIRPASATAA